MDNILINFTADPSGLQPGIDGLVQMQVADKELADQVKKTSAEMSKRDKAVSDGVNKSASSIDKLSSSFKGLDKNIVGGTYNQKLKELQKQISGASDEFKALAIAIDFAKKRQTEFKPNTPEWQELQQQIEQAQIVLKTFGSESVSTGGKAESLRTKLADLKNVLHILQEQGQENTHEFEQISIEAAHVQDQIDKTNERIRALASSTANIDAVIGTVRGLAAGFEVAASAEALLGEKNEDFEKALVKLNAIMALSNGLREIQEVLKEQSIVRLKAEAVGQVVLATSTRLTSAAFASLGIAVEATSVAFKVLRGAIIATGIGALVVGIGFLVEKISEWTAHSETAIETQNRLAKTTHDLNEAILEQNNLYVDAISFNKTQLEKQLSLVQAAGGSQLRQLDLRRQIAEEDKKIGENILKNLGLTENKVTILENSINANLEKIKAANELAKNDKTENQKKATKTIIEQAQAQIDAIKGLADAGRKAVDQVTNASIQSASIVEETTKLLNDNSLKSAAAYAQARVLLAKMGSQQELDARTSALKAQEAQELANVNLTQGERIKIQANTLREAAELQFAFDQKAQEDAVKSIQARASLEQEGTRKRMDLEQSALDLQKKAELQTSVIVNGQLVQLKELTEQQKAEIEDRYLKLSSDKLRAQNKADAESEINTRIAQLQKQNAALSIEIDADTNDQLLQNKKELVDREAQLEILSIIESVHNEEERTAKIRAVYAKALADKKKLEQDKNKADIDEGLQFADALYGQLIVKNKKIVDSDKSTAKQRLEAQKELHRFEIASIDAAALANEQSYQNDLISYAQYLQKKNELQAQYDAVDLEKQKEQEAIRDQVREASFNILQQATDAFFTAQDQRRQDDLSKQIDKLERQKDAELSYADLTQDQKDQINKKYAIRENQLKKKAYEDEKKAKKAQAEINGFLAITNILATRPKFDLGIGDAIMIAAAVASTALQVAAIGNTKFPEFYKGTKSAPGGFKWVGERGPELIYDGGGYPIIPHEKSKSLADKNFFDPEIMRSYNIPMRSFSGNMPYLSDDQTQAIEKYYASNSSQIDYDRLANAIAEKMGDRLENLPTQSLSIDENGFHATIRKGSDEINFINKKLNL